MASAPPTNRLMLGPPLLDPALLDGWGSDPSAPPSRDRRRAGDLIDGWWFSTTSGAGTVVPDGAVDLMWAVGAVPFLAGPDTAPRPVDLPPGRRVVAVRLRPGVGSEVIGDGLDRAVGRRVSLDEVWGRSCVDRLGEDLAVAAEAPAGSDLDARAGANALAAAVRRRVPVDWRPDPVVTGAIDAIGSLHAIGASHTIDTQRPVDGRGLGQRQLRRRFTSAIGYGPALYRRIVRLDRFTDLLAAERQRPLAELAVAAGFYDQAHLSRDCQELLGATPSQLRAGP